MKQNGWAHKVSAMSSDFFIVSSYLSLPQELWIISGNVIGVLTCSVLIGKVGYAAEKNILRLLRCHR
jgi:hypothetical protein